MEQSLLNGAHGGSSGMPISGATVSLQTRAKDLNASVILYYLTASIDKLYKRIQLRDMEDPPIKKETVIEWVDIFQIPDEDEMKLYDEFYSIS